MKAEPLTANIHVRATARLKAALEVMFLEDAEEYRSVSEYVTALLGRIARKKVPHFFTRSGDLPGAAPASGPQPQGRRPGRVSSSTSPRRGAQSRSLDRVRLEAATAASARPWWAGQGSGSSAWLSSFLPLQGRRASVC